jgi:hypothetical protein
MAMKRLRVLASALALGDFTIAELSVYSGVNENTVRSLIGRERHRFEQSEGHGEREPGRPAKRYRLLDRDEVRTELAELESGIRDADVGASEVGGEEERLAAAVVGENALLRSLQSDSAEERQILCEVAFRSAAQALDDDRSTSNADEPLRRRARAVSVLSQLAVTDRKGQLVEEGELHEAARALAELAETAPAENVLKLLAGLAWISASHDELPPLALILDEGLTPQDAVPGIAEEHWVRRSAGGAGQSLWSQAWAEDLVEQRLIAGLVVHDHDYDEEQLEKTIARFADWGRPTAVVSRAETSRATSIAASGAMLIPAPGVRSVLMAALVNSLGIGTLKRL